MDCSLHHPDMPKPQAVSVNGVTIAREAIAREVQHHPAAKPIMAWKAAARALVVRELLLQEARRVGVAATPATDAAGRRETDEEALIRALVERDVNVPQPDEATCRRYYEQNKRSFRSSTLYEAAHILFAARRDDAEAFAAAQRQANVVLAELRKNPHRFKDCAEAYSECSSGKQGGNLGQITSGQTTPEFEAALVALQPGDISGPVTTRYGVHIIHLARKIEGRPLPFELVADRIADYLRESVMRRATAQYIARLVSRAAITGVTLDDADTHRVH